MPDLLKPIVEQTQSEGHFPPGEWRALWMPRDPGRAVALVFARGEARPKIVVKLEPAPGEKLIRERDVLRRIHGGGGSFYGEVPRVLEWVEEGGRVLLATDVLEGRPLKRASARQLRRAMNPGVDWLLKFHRALGVKWAEGRAGWERHVLPHVAAYRTNYVVSEEAGRVIEETFKPHPPTPYEAPMKQSGRGSPALRERGSLPLVIRHGDFNTANVLWNHGRVQVVDWESWGGPDPAGPDLCYWLQSCQPGRAREVKPRFRRAFFTPGDPADAARCYYDALGVAPEMRWPLFLLGWMIQANDKRPWLPDNFIDLDDAAANKHFGLAYVSRGTCLNVEWACAWRDSFAV